MISFSATTALGAAVIILLIGFRVYLLDRSNYQYRAFGALCALLSWMCFCWYGMEQTDDQPTAAYWRRLQSVWTLTNPLIVYCCWRFANLYLQPVSLQIKQLLYVFILMPALIFFGLEAFTDFAHGRVVLLENGHWGLAIEGMSSLTICRGIWSALVYGSAIYFIYLVWRAETVRFRKIWLMSLLILLSTAACLTITQNYILPVNGVTLPANEAYNTLISVLFFGWALSDFQLFDLKPESAFEHVAGSMSNLMIITNTNFRIKSINPAALGFFSTTKAAARNAALEHVVGKKAAELLKDQISGRVKEEVRLEHGHRIARILFSTSLIRNRRGRLIGYVFIGNDLTDYYQALEEIQHYNARLENSNQSLERFAYVVSHDLKEPLRTINGFITLLDRKMAASDDQEIREYLGYINRGAIRMNALIDSILTISRLGNEDEQEDNVSLERVVLEIDDKLRALRHQKKAVIQYDTANLPVIRGKYYQISLLFQNLIENGIKYNISPSPHVRLSCRKSTEGYEFSVEDNGIGIEKKYHDQVFQMFKRLHSWADYEGTGIGLTICKKIVEELGGRIWIEARANGEGGAIFKFVIPMTVGNHESVRESGPGATGLTYGRAISAHSTPNHTP